MIGKHFLLSISILLPSQFQLPVDCVVGGKLVNPPSAVPWVASIRKSGKHRCGGTLITPNWIITAGHCLDEDYFTFSQSFNIPRKIRSLENITIFVSGLQKEIPVSNVKVYCHPKFSKATLHHDVALWRLNVSIQLDSWPILDSSEDSFAGWIGMALGWGSDWKYGEIAHNLHKVLLPILARNACMAALGESIVLSGMICAGGLSKQDTCKGDSGGPLVVAESQSSGIKPVYYLVGVVSWGLHCGVFGYPGIYTSVSEHLEWIKSKIHK